MQGTVQIANAPRGRYAVLSEDGGYTTFELLDGDPLIIGEPLSGDLESLGGGELKRADGTRVSVFVENFHCSASNALNWVRG